MKRLVLAAVLFATPVLAAGPSTPAPRVVREFVQNGSFADWVINAGWAWSGGTLTHWPGAVGSVQQAVMPALTPDRTYRVDVAFSGRTHGSVRVSLGDASYVHGGPKEGTYSILLKASNPDALLQFTPTSDYDGSIANVRVVELGTELVDRDGWILPSSPSPTAGEITPSASTPALQRAMTLVRGRTYRVYFGILPTSTLAPNPISATVSLTGLPSFQLPLTGNYAYDLTAAQDGGQVSVVPDNPAEWQALFDGIIGNLTVREITTDAAPVAAGKVTASLGTP